MRCNDSRVRDVVGETGRGIEGGGVHMERKRTRDLDAVDGAVGGHREKEMMLQIQRIGAR